MDQNQQAPGQGRGRRGHFNRGRRGPDRRGHQEPRNTQSPEPQQKGDHVDVEQIMRDIRARIAHRHGIDLSPAQIRELAARRLEAILDPRNVNPTLLEQLRRAAGERPTRIEEDGAHALAYTFEDSTLYESSRGILTTIRRLLNPILKLFFNPNPLIQALNTQAKLNGQLVARDRERDQRQTEWNALHYELVQRVVTENARLSLELEALSLKLESLGARVDFADRRVRAIEAAPQPSRPGRSAPDPRPAQEQPVLTHGGGGVAPGGQPQNAGSTDSPGSQDGQRRKRRRRRGRRPGGPFGEGIAPVADAMAPGTAEPDEFDETDEGGVDDVLEGLPGSEVTQPVAADAAAEPNGTPAPQTAESETAVPGPSADSSTPEPQA